MLKGEAKTASPFNNIVAWKISSTSPIGEEK